MTASTIYKVEKPNIFTKIITGLRDDPVSWSVIILITTFFFVFLIMPLAEVLVSAVWRNGEFKFDTYTAIFQNEYFWDPTGKQSVYSIRIDHQEDVSVYLIRGPNLGVFFNTIVIGLLTTFISLILGIITAFLMARVEFKGKTLLGGLLLIPLVLPPFVSGVGFISIMGRNGLLNQHFFKPYFGIKIVLEGIVAIVFVQSLHYFTLIYLNVHSSFMNIDPSMEESAENLGASRFKIFRTVTLPLAMPGIASGSILVLILSMEDLGTPIIFAGLGGDPVAAQTITFYISRHIFVSPDSSEIAQETAILGASLLIFSLVGFYMIRKYVSLRQYSMVSKGRAGEFRTFTPNKVGKGFIYLFFIVLITTATIPHIGVILASTAKAQTFPLEFTTKNFEILFDGDQGFRGFIENTLKYSLISTFLIIILATLAGYVANRKKFRGQTAFDTLVTIPIAIPGIVLGIGLMRMFGSTDVWYFGDRFLTLNPIIYPPTLLVISYTIRKFPFTVRAVYAGLQQTDVVLEESAMNLGAGKVRVLGQIIIPIIALNIIAGALVSLVYNMSEVSTTLILVSNSNYGTLTWKMSDARGQLGELAAIGVFLMTLQTISLLVTNLLLRNRAEALTGL